MFSVYEVWHYDKFLQYNRETVELGLFSEYIDTFMQMKQEADGWPSYAVTDEQKAEYIESYYEREGIRLNPANIAKNPNMRQLAKLMLNSFWGKVKYINFQILCH